MEVRNVRQGQIDTHKAKLNARLSLRKGGSILGINALAKVKDLKRKATEDAIKKARTKIVQYENKAKRELHERGVQARKEEKARIQFISSHQFLGTQIPDDKWLPIRDPEKDPLLAETEALRANQSFYDKVARLEHESQQLQLDDPTLFTSVQIDPEILRIEHEFKIQQMGGLSQIQVLDEEDQGDDDREEADCNTSDSDDISPPRSVASIDSI